MRQKGITSFNWTELKQEEHHFIIWYVALTDFYSELYENALT